MTDESQTPHGGGNYVVVARRYRPQGFDELIGQQHVSQALTRAITSDRVGHAYLFTGARGVGKTSAARILAKALNCQQGPTTTPCNVCEICESIAAGEDVDVLEIDGASNRGIDEIRQLRQNVAVRPSRSRLKIYIIDEVHMLTKEAFNALLKTLEEPPEHVKFIFATTEANKIPITILSRCQRFDFAGIEQSAIQNRLAQIAQAEGVTIEPDALQILAMRAAGSMRDSQSLLEQLLSSGGNAITSADVTQMLGIAPAARLSRLVTPLVEGDAATALTELDAALAEGAEVSQIMDQLLGFFRDVMTQAVGCDENRLMYALPSQREEVCEIATRVGIHKLLAISQVLDQAAARMRSSTHARTIAEIAIVRISTLEVLDDLARLIDLLQDPSASVPVQGVKKNSLASPARSHPASPVKNLPTREATEPAHSSYQSSTQDIETIVANSVPLVAENVEQIWKQALDSLTGMVAEHAAHVEDVIIDPQEKMVISFSEAFYRDSCERAANRARLEAAIEAVCGRRVPLVLQTVARAESTQPAPPPAVSRRQQQSELLSHPFVKKAVELFDAQPEKLRYVPPAE